MNFWDFVWGSLVVFFFAMFFVVFIGVAMDVFRSRDLNGAMKAGWLILLVVLPVIGVLIYTIARGPGMADRMADRDARDGIANTEAIVAGGGGAASGPAEQIALAKELHGAGAITEDEYNRLKEKALA